MEVVELYKDNIEVREAYAECLDNYKEAQEALKTSLQKMHRAGIYPPPPEAVRFCLPDERHGMVHAFRLGMKEKEIKMYIQTGMYTEERGVGEIFLEASKEGSFVSGMVDAFAVVFSIALQHGIPLPRLVEKFKHTRFEPDGMLLGPVRNASSVVDYVAQWLELRYVKEAKGAEVVSE